MSVESYCRKLSWVFFADGHDADDLYQEARLAAWLAPDGLERLAARRRVIGVRSARRRPMLAREVDVEVPDNVLDVVEARARLRAVLAAARTENERTALARVMRDEPITRDEHALQVALWRLRRKLSRARARRRPTRRSRPCRRNESRPSVACWLR